MSGATGSVTFVTPAEEREADRFGMWVFLGSEALLFGALMLAYLVARLHHPQGFSAGSRELSFWLGTVNTGVLITSSLTMALADAAAEAGAWRPARWLMLATAALGLIFLGIKLAEYCEEIGKGLAPLLGISLDRDGPDAGGMALFINLYFSLTALHALHLLSGLLAIAAISTAWMRNEPAHRLRQVAGIGLYWHFVDIVWVFLYPLLYLISR